MEQARDQEDRHKQRASKRGSTAVGKQSLREIYRRLASAIHPDREHDPQRRAEKTELMQTINRAYAANDLLSLLELQLELLSEEVAHRQTGTQRLREYNKLLSEQLSRLRAELQELQADFQMEYGLAPTGVLSGNTLRQQLKREARGLRGEIARQRELLQIFSTKTGARKWLRERRRLVRLDPGEDESGADSD
jgi:hypothetical protein